MKTVLIPTDFSKNALHALQYAQELFKCERACFLYCTPMARRCTVSTKQQC